MQEEAAAEQNNVDSTFAQRQACQVKRVAYWESCCGRVQCKPVAERCKPPGCVEGLFAGEFLTSISAFVYVQTTENKQIWLDNFDGHRL